MSEQIIEFIKRKSELNQKAFPLEVIHMGEPANNMGIFHWHEFMEISFIEDGHGIYEIEDKIFNVKKGDVVIINGIEKHRLTYRSTETVYETVIHFDTKLIWTNEYSPMDHTCLKLFSKGANFINRPELEEDGKRIIHEIISDIVNEYVENKPYFELIIKSKLMLMIGYLLRQGGTWIINQNEVAIRRNNIDRLEKIIDYINDNFKEDLSMEKVAVKFFMNSSYFSEYFKKNIGINFSEYLTRLRINEAIKLLSENKLNSSEIAYICGFNNPSSFYSAFRKITGTNPRSYRK